jgi:hypothetical protein
MMHGAFSFFTKLDGVLDVTHQREPLPAKPEQKAEAELP